MTLSPSNSNWGKNSPYLKLDDWDEYIKSFSDKLTSVVYKEVLGECKKITTEELAIEEQIKIKEQEIKMLKNRLK